MIMGSAIMLLKRYVKNSKIRLVLQILCAAVIMVTICGRVISGVHWITDIIGGVLISAALLMLYSGIVEGKSR